MELIGGVMVDGALRRDVALKPLSGAIELILADLAGSDIGQPQRVTLFLEATVAEIGGRPLDRDGAAALSVGDRQHLVRRIGAAMGRDLVWLNSACGECGEGFDIPVRQSELPVKPAGRDYPESEIRLRGAAVRLRAPTGADQAAVAELDEAEAVHVLLGRLVDGSPETADLTEAEQAALDDALEAMMPEVGLEALAVCPECKAENRVAVDPYLALALTGGDIYQDIHLLARHYHWSEPEILALPRARRQQYLRLIDRERGMISHDAPVGRA